MILKWRLSRSCLSAVLEDPLGLSLLRILRMLLLVRFPCSVQLEVSINSKLPGALCAHTRDRDQSPSVVYEFLYNATSLTPAYDWPTSCKGADVIFGYAFFFLCGKCGQVLTRRWVDYLEEEQSSLSLDKRLTMGPTFIRHSKVKGTRSSTTILSSGLWIPSRKRWVSSRLETCAFVFFHP